MSPNERVPVRSACRLLTNLRLICFANCSRVLNRCAVISMAGKQEGVHGDGFEAVSLSLGGGYKMPRGRNGTGPNLHYTAEGSAGTILHLTGSTGSIGSCPGHVTLSSGSLHTQQCSDWVIEMTFISKYHQKKRKYILCFNFPLQ